MSLTKGVAALVLVARRRGWKLQRQLAADVGLDEPRVSRLLSGKVLPNRSEAVRLRDRCGIDPAMWDLDADAADLTVIDEGINPPSPAPETQGAA